jgi:hypothetical protein
MMLIGWAALLFVGQVEDYTRAMKEALEAAEAKDWARAARLYGDALRARPADPDAERGFRSSIRNLEIYNTRFGELKARTIEKYGLTGVEPTIEAGLKWLARTQHKDGHWEHGSPNWRENVAATSFALLAFLADGNSEITGPWKENVRRAVEWLVAQQKENGAFGGTRLYTEGLAVLACVEAFAMGGTENTYIAANKGINFIVKAQKPEGGWMYGPESGGGGDTSVNGMMFQPLMQGKAAYLDFDVQSLERGRKFTDLVTDEAGWVGYRGKGDGSNDPTRVVLTAIGNLIRIYAGVKLEDPAVQKGLKLVDAHRDRMKENMYLVYYGTMLTFLAGGKFWDDWRGILLKHLKEKQIREGEDAGSWAAEGGGHARGYPEWAGRVCTTAMAILSLECGYRYVPKAMLPE